MDKAKLFCITEIQQLLEEIRILHSKNYTLISSLSKYKISNLSSILSDLNKESTIYTSLPVYELKKLPIQKLEKIKTKYLEHIDKLLNQDLQLQQMSSKYAFLSSENQNDKLNNPIITKNLENILRKCDSDNEEFEVLQERDQNGAKTDRSNSKYQSLMGEYAKAQDTIKILKRKIVQKNENKSCFYFPKIEELQNEPQISDFNNDFNKEGNKRLWSYIFRLQNYIADEVSNNERFKKEIMLEMKEKDQLIQRLSKTKNCNDENIALNKLVGNASPEEIVEILKIRRKKGGFKQFINEKVHLEKENGLLRNELEEIEREKLASIEEIEKIFNSEKEKIEIERNLLEIERNKLQTEKEELSHLRDLFQLTRTFSHK